MKTRLAKTVVLAGRILLENGAETHRVEDTMRRMCEAYGAQVTDSYVTPGMLMISFSYDGEMVHNMKRTGVKTTDLGKIDAVNTLSRNVSSLALEELYEQLQKVETSPGPSTGRYSVGAFVAAAGFAALFGSTGVEALAAGWIGGCCAFLLRTWGSRFSSAFQNMAGSAFMTACALVCPGLGLGAQPVLLGALMILVPGMLLTNAIRDIVNGDSISGTSRLAEAIVTAAAIAVGNLAVLALRGGV